MTSSASASASASTSTSTSTSSPVEIEIWTGDRVKKNFCRFCEPTNRTRMIRGELCYHTPLHDPRSWKTAWVPVSLLEMVDRTASCSEHGAHEAELRREADAIDRCKKAGWAPCPNHGYLWMHQGRCHHEDPKEDGSRHGTHYGPGWPMYRCGWRSPPQNSAARLNRILFGG